MALNISPQFRRRRKLIHYRIQLLLIFHTVLFAALTILTGHLVAVSRIFNEVDVPVLGVVQTGYLWWLPLPVMVICLLWGFWLSNRIVGPIFNLRRYLERYLAGEVTGPVRCREDDFFQELFVVVNRVLAHQLENDHGKNEKR